MTHNPLRSCEQFTLPPRRPPTKAEKVASWNRENGVCYLCGKPVAMEGPQVEWEHRLARAISANDQVENIYPVHPRCHVPKTAEDAGLIAKAKRQEKLTRPREKKRSSLSHPRLVRGFDGIVRPRS